MCRVMENEKLVIKIVNKYFKKYAHKGRLNQSYEDLVQSGMFGLVKADNTFKEETGYEFSTYAWRVVYNQIMTYVKREILGEQGKILGQDVKVSLNTPVKGKYNDNILLADTIRDKEQVNEFKIDLEIFLDKLPSIQRERFTKKVLEGRLTEDLAKVEGVTHQAIDSTCRLVKNKIKKEFENYYI